MSTSKPSPSENPTLVITEPDFARLTRLLDGHGEGSDRLADELLRATVVPREEVPATVATMNSVVVYEDDASGVRRSVRIVFPKDAKLAGAVSVLAPVGCALLGLSVGQTIEWDVPSARRRFRVVEIAYQPEAAGHVDP